MRKGVGPIFLLRDWLSLDPMGQEKDHIKYTFWCHFNRMFSETHQKSAEARDALSTDEHLDVSNPFPKTNLSSVDVDGVEVGCHQSPQHEEEADEAGTREPEGRYYTGSMGGPSGPPSRCIIAANTHTPVETRAPGCGSSAGQPMGS